MPRRQELQHPKPSDGILILGVNVQAERPLVINDALPTAGCGAEARAGLGHIVPSNVTNSRVNLYSNPQKDGEVKSIKIVIRYM